MGEYHSMSPSTTLPVHKDSSHTISKTRPKIKIIHIIAPEIIKTDVANFRDLVQRLTGKPAASTADVAPSLPPVEEEQKEAIKKRPPPPAAAERGDFMVPQENKKKIKCEVKVQEGGLGDGLDHNELWMDLNPGGFLSFLEEDVFQGMAPDFLQPLGSSRMDLVGEMKIVLINHHLDGNSKDFVCCTRWSSIIPLFWSPILHQGMYRLALCSLLSLRAPI